MLFSVSAAIHSCNNSASDPNNEADQAHDSLTEVGDTITRHATSFSTAIHQMTNDLTQVPPTGDENVDFAVLLKSHHQGAVDLAQAELKMGKDNTLRKIAQDIVSIRKKEISALQNFVDSLKKGPLTVNLTKNYENSGFGKVITTHKAMMWDISKMDTNMVADQQFAAVMIPQLQSTVYLTEGFLKHGTNPWLTQKAEEIIPRNMKQIKELRQWADKNKNTP